VDFEALGGLVAEELHGIAALDQGQALGDETLQLDRADLRAVLLLLAAALHLLVAVELPLDPVDGAMEQVDGRPQQVLEVGLETGVGEGRDQRIEDVDDGAGDDVAFRQRAGIGLVLEGTVTVCSCSSVRT
jgi:hypothetical protein